MRRTTLTTTPRHQLIQSALVSSLSNHCVLEIKTRWLYCVECPHYSTRLESLGCLCDCLSGTCWRSMLLAVSLCYFCLLFKLPESTWYGGSPRPRRHCVTCMGTQLSSPGKGYSSPQLFGASLSLLCRSRGFCVGLMMIMMMWMMMMSGL